MPNLDLHIKKYKHNKDFSNILLKDEYCDWQITAAFYAALHLVEAVLSKENIHPTSHEERENVMLDNYKIFNNDAMNNYHVLRNLSHKARYTDIIENNEELYLAKESLSNIEEEIKKYID